MLASTYLTWVPYPVPAITKLLTSQQLGPGPSADVQQPPFVTGCPSSYPLLPCEPILPKQQLLPLIPRPPACKIPTTLQHHMQGTSLTFLIRPLPTAPLCLP
jgi:hypothetical protein